MSKAIRILSNEIKEILEGIEVVIKNDGTLEFDAKELKILLDCITNLQEKVDQYENPNDLTLFYMWLDEKAKDKMKQLQKKYERMKENAKILSNGYNDLEKRNEKAIEYLEDRIENSEGCIYVEIPEEKYILEQEEILNILKGEDKE